MVRQRYMRRFLIIWISTFFSLSVAADSYAPINECGFLAGGLPGEATTRFESWSWGQKTIIIKPEQLLPAKYLKDLQAEFGEINLVQKLAKDRHIFTIKAGKEEVAHFEFHKTDLNAKALVVEELVLANPLSDGKHGELNLDQYKAGLPPEIFRYARDHVKALAKAGGFTHLYALGQQNFIVLSLYRRTVGMEPIGDRRFIDHVDKLYRYARKEMPEAYRPQNVQEFSEILGSYMYIRRLSARNRELWDNYVAKGEIDPSIEVLKNADGEFMGMVFEKGLPTQKVFFASPAALGPVEPLKWHDAVNKSWAVIGTTL